MTDSLFGTAINCIDGRVQKPVSDWLKEQYEINYVDMLTEPGPELVLSEGSDHQVLQLLKRKVELSITGHRSKLVAVVGHYDCLGNPTDKETQSQHIARAVNQLKTWDLKIEVIGLQVDEDWHVHRV